MYNFRLPDFAQPAAKLPGFSWSSAVSESKSSQWPTQQHWESNSRCDCSISLSAILSGGCNVFVTFQWLFRGFGCWGFLLVLCFVVEMVESCKQVSKVTLGTEVKDTNPQLKWEESVTSAQVLVLLRAKCCVSCSSEGGEEKLGRFPSHHPTFCCRENTSLIHGVPWSQHFHLGGKRFKAFFFNTALLF